LLLIDEIAEAVVWAVPACAREAANHRCAQPAGTPASAKLVHKPGDQMIKGNASRRSFVSGSSR
jgi:hypothetical protein